MRHLTAGICLTFVTIFISATESLALPPCPENQNLRYHNCFGTYSTDGNKYVGEFKNDKLNGHGTFFWASGDKYVGEFKNGSRNGTGTLFWDSGDKYVGEWKDGSHNGQGTLFWVSGDKYVGEWKDGSRNGQGTLFWANGTIEEGTFKDDEFIHAKKTSPPEFVPDFEKGLVAYNSADYAKALKEWVPLAEHGHAAAQFKLGVMYDNGEGVPQDDIKAVKWYRLAAEQGYTKAQYNLGVMFYNGEGVIRDNVRAHMWSNISASNGDGEASKNRDRIAVKLTSEEISKAQSMAKKCMDSNYKNCGD